MFDFSMFDLTLGISREAMAEQRRKLLESQNLDAATKSYLEGINDNDIDKVFKEYDKNEDGFITTDETSLVELDFDDDNPEKISKEDFLKMNLSNLQGADLEAVFDYLDKNKTGYILQSDIDNLTAEEIQGFMPQATEENPQTQVPEATDDADTAPLTPEDSQDTPEQAADVPVSNDNNVDPVDYSGSGFENTGGAGGGGNGGGGGSRLDNAAPAETLEAVRAQKQKLISDADAKIEAKNNELNTAINEDENVSSELKEEYTGLTSELNTVNSNIAAKESEISGYDSEIQSTSASIAGMESELSTLEARNPDDPETKEKITDRISKLKSNISEAETKLQELEGKKETAEGELSNLKTQKEEIETAINQVEQKILEDNPQLKTVIDTIKGEIKEIETEKTTQIAELDTKIAELSNKQTEESKAAGQVLGSPMGQYMSQLFDDIADSADIVKQSEGQTDYCSKYIASCIKKLFEQNGITGIDVPLSPNGQLNWVNSFPDEIKVYDFTKMSDEEKRNFQLQPGMIVKMQWQGTSNSNPQMHTKNHVQFVKEPLGNGEYISQDWDSGKGVGEENASILDSKVVAIIDWSGLLKYAENYNNA